MVLINLLSQVIQKYHILIIFSYHTQYQKVITYLYVYAYFNIYNIGTLRESVQMRQKIIVFS
jgi:hypothetical protein